MDQKTIALLVLLTFSLFLFSEANAVIVYLRPPKMIIRLNTSDTVERELVIENRNNISMKINSTIDGNISEVLTIKNPSFEILPNETRTIDFITNAIKPGIYHGKIIVTYTTDVIEPITVPSEITVIVTKNPNSSIDIPLIPISVIVIILVIITSISWFIRGRNDDHS